MAHLGTILAALSAVSLAMSSIPALANTRASETSTSYVPALGNTPFSPMEDEDDDEGGAPVWFYLLGGVGLWAIFAATLSGGSSGDRPVIGGNQSNGAN